MRKEDVQQQNQLDFEPFYGALEDDSKLLEEALEILLKMVDLESKSIKKVALYIKSLFILKRIRQIYIMR